MHKSAGGHGNGARTVITTNKQTEKRLDKQTRETALCEQQHRRIDKQMRQTDRLLSYKRQEQRP